MEEFMKVLLVNGSPNKDGCTFTALSEVGSSLKSEGVESEIFHIGHKPVRGCIACGKCIEKKNFKCVFDDDICNELSAKILEFDGLVVGSPVYYSGPNGALCALLDRVFYSASRNFKHKPAACVVSCRRGGASAAFDRLNKYFTIAQMPVVSSQYWNAVNGHDADDVRKDLEGLQIMRVLGHNMAWMLKCLGSGEAPPEPEAKRLWTSFPDGL
jgi:multimeric flavodoxin WrbA